MAESRRTVTDPVVVKDHRNEILHRTLRTLAQWVIAVGVILFLLFGSNWIS